MPLASHPMSLSHWGRFATCGLLSTVVLIDIASSTMAQERRANDVQEWIDNTGKHRVEARFIRIDGNQVVLKREDGKEIKIPFDRLSKDSIAQAKSMATSAVNSKGSAAASTRDATDVSSDASTIALDNLDAKSFVDLIMSEVRKKNGTIVWDALPSEKQQDIESLVAMAAKRLDSRTFDMVRKTRNTVLEIARKQQQFILNSDLIPIPPDQKPMIEQSYPAIVGMIDSYIPKDLLDSKRLQKGDFRSLMEAWAKNVYASADELAKSLPEGHPIRAQLMDYSGVEYSVNSISSSEADVTLKVPGPDGNVQETTLTLKLSDGRWLPKDMVDRWDEGLAQAKAAVGMIQAEQIHQMVSGVLLVVNAPLQNLKNAKTQEDFDKTLQELLAIAQGAAMSSMGGGPPGGPPGGFPGRGGPPGAPPGGLPGGLQPPLGGNSGASGGGAKEE